MKRNAFTLIELLVVITIISILAALLLPSLAKAKQQSQGIKCLSNVKQFSTAWVLYAGDHSDHLVTNTCGENTNSWAAGFLDWPDPDDPDNTNILNLMSPYGLLWPYSQSLSIYIVYDIQRRNGKGLDAAAIPVFAHSEPGSLRS